MNTLQTSTGEQWVPELEAAKYLGMSLPNFRDQSRYKKDGRYYGKLTWRKVAGRKAGVSFEYLLGDLEREKASVIVLEVHPAKTG